ncbi:HtaA domain-containing protein [Streptomyces sp. YIM 98790]|uniref:HtaA domain-containing protein n=1 Tax=Streptomyces sp. YIM 98790 TaxID=2689077 RepID=UPI0014079066|nr:HtaA domain-containing protein [Streptomyces sp. YIM 98790]
MLPGFIRTALAALCLALLPAAPAHAAERTVSGGRLDWGIKASFPTYVTGPIAQGGWTLTGNAGTAGQNQFRFHSAQGDYDPGTGEFTARYSGGVRFTGHRAEDGTYELDLTVSNPSVRISGSSGTLHADMRSRDRETGRFTERSQVPLAALDLGGAEMRGGTRIELSGVPATLTAEGAEAFAGYYRAGDALDPVSLTADTFAPEPEPGPEPEPEREPEPEAEPEPGAGRAGPGGQTGQEPATGDTDGPRPIVDAAVDWGVRRTFREYVTGDVARGEWRLTDGARDGGAVFRFPAGTGGHDPATGALEARFRGSVHFTGHELDLALGPFEVRIEDGTGTLLADVTTDGGGTRLDGLPLVTFDAAGAGPDDGLFIIAESPAVLTEEGAAAFGGRYPAGTAMDPVTLSVALDEDAALPPPPDLGSEPAPAATAEAAGGPDAGDGRDGGDAGAEQPAAAGQSSSGSTAVLAVAVAAAAVPALAAAGYLAVRRRSRDGRPAPAGSATAKPGPAGPAEPAVPADPDRPTAS